MEYTWSNRQYRIDSIKYHNLMPWIFSGYAYDSDCIYVNGTGEDEYEFYIQLNRCGTLGGSDHHKKRNANHEKNRDPTVSIHSHIHHRMEYSILNWRWNNMRNSRFIQWFQSIILRSWKRKIKIHIW